MILGRVNFTMVEQPWWLQDPSCQFELPSSQAVCNGSSGRNSTIKRLNMVENCVAGCQPVHLLLFWPGIVCTYSEYTVGVCNLDRNFDNSFHCLGTIWASSARGMTRLLLYRQRCIFLSAECTFIHTHGNMGTGWVWRSFVFSYHSFFDICQCCSAIARSTAGLLHKALF